MARSQLHPLAQLDHRYVWHPFTQMRDWLKTEPIVLMSGSGAVLRDVHGREYLDANASIWTNLHGHAHPKINAAIRRQLPKVAHTSALGFANETASLLAEKLIQAAGRGSPSPDRQAPLAKVFFSDNGSTAMEVALKLAYECGRRSGRTPKPRFLSLAGAYHGDTVGAVSLGHIDLFHKAYGGLLFKSDQVMAPYCYRCPYNRAKPERADARVYRQCGWECLGKVRQCFHKAAQQGRPYTGFVFEPLMQGAAGMIPQPDGWLSQAAVLAREHGAMLIADEIMTGFGRTTPPGLPPASGQRRRAPAAPSLFACHHEGVQPDFLCLAKGLSGGYLPMAATLTTQAVFDAFLGEYSEFKTFFHGHTYTGNQLAAAASLASLDLLEANAAAVKRAKLGIALRDALAGLWSCPHVGDIRQVGLVAGVELVRDWRTRQPFDLTERVGIRVCEAMARRGVLTRPVGSVIVLMPPYCTTPRQVKTIVDTLREGLGEVLGA